VFRLILAAYESGGFFVACDDRSSADIQFTKRPCNVNRLLVKSSIDDFRRDRMDGFARQARKFAPLEQTFKFPVLACEIAVTTAYMCKSLFLQWHFQRKRIK
jgi:hypothetical protein